MPAANGKAQPTPFILEARANGLNPFTVVRADESAPDVTFPRVPGVSEALTREEKRIYLKGRSQVLRLGLQVAKGAYATQEMAKLEDHLNRTYEHTGVRIAARTRRPHDPALQPYLDALEEAQLLRMGQAMSQVVDTTERMLHEIVEEDIAVADEEEAQPGFFQKLLRGQQRPPW
jgi:hypothetical protein